MPSIRIVYGIFSIFLLLACSEQSTESTPQEYTPTVKLTVTGSSTIAPLAAELARRFEQKTPSVKIDVQTGGSSRGVSDVRQSVADIGMVSRALKVKEKDLSQHLIAFDGVSVIVNKNNPIKELSEEQIKAIYLGKIHNWKTLTGKDAVITVVNKSESHSTLEVFLNFFNLKSRNVKADTIIGDNEQAVKLVENNPNAIAYVSIGTAEYDIAHNSNIKTLPLHGVPASTANLANQSFPLRRELNMVTQGKMSTAAKSFIAFVQSTEATSVIREFGFVPPQI
ncbi:MAG: phosphate ABC transporter substrate-binding protein [Gammaproteobacteria bacterium]|nr:phosphate ABC transporter substrate-binding protein [Gammaproteobacteria bacterium]